MPNCEESTSCDAQEKSRRLHTWIVQLFLNGPGKSECSTCGIIKPLRSKHSTGACIPVLDHYCVWTGGPVSATNHRAFVVFVAIQLVHLFTIVPCLSAILLRKDWSFAHAFSALLTVKGYLTAAVTFTVVFFTIFTAALLVEQLRNAAQGVTTNERLNAKRFKYVQEVLSRKLTAKDAWRRLVRWFSEGQYAGVDVQLLRDVVAALPDGQQLQAVQDCPVATCLPDPASQLWDNADVRVSLKRIGVRSAGEWYSQVRDALQAAV